MPKFEPEPGRRLCTWRESARHSMEELARRAARPITASTINKLEKAEIEFTMTHAESLAPALGKHPLEFFLDPADARWLERHRALEDDDRETVTKVADAMIAARRRSSESE